VSAATAPHRRSRMPDVLTYHEGFDLKATEPPRVEVLALNGGPVTLSVSIAGAVQSIHLTADEARTLARLLARAAIAASEEKGGRPPRHLTPR
jgi:hypothetical protein